jgi:hypothetical protein
MSEFLAQFRPDPEFPEDRWVWWTSKPVLVNYVSEFAPFDDQFQNYKIPKKRPYPLEPSCTWCSVADFEVAVFIFENDLEAVSSQQRAWDYLVANAALVEHKLAQKLTFIQRQCLDQLAQEIAEGGPYADQWEIIRSKVPSPETDLNRFYKLVGITLASSGLDNLAFVGFEFQTAWDKDHGLEIVMHKDRVLAKAGMTELISGYGSVLDGIKGTQAFELDPCDFKLE